jgi:hypothetical protein
LVDRAPEKKSLAVDGHHHDFVEIPVIAATPYS